VRCPHPHRWKCTQVVPAEPKTIGEHIKKRRLQLHLMQSDLAERLGVHWGSIQNWERGIGEPMIRQMPKIIEFLGFDPMPEPTGLPARIAYARRRLGWTQKELARALKVDAVSIYRWEKGLSAPPAEAIHRLLALEQGSFKLATVMQTASLQSRLSGRLRASP